MAPTEKLDSMYINCIFFFLLMFFVHLSNVFVILSHWPCWHLIFKSIFLYFNLSGSRSAVKCTKLSKNVFASVATGSFYSLKDLQCSYIFCSLEGSP